MYFRPLLEKMLFLVQRPGESNRADGKLFFQFSIFFFTKKNSVLLLPNKKKRKKKEEIAAARVAIISATRWTGNKLFLQGGLICVLLR